MLFCRRRGEVGIGMRVCFLCFSWVHCATGIRRAKSGSRKPFDCRFRSCSAVRRRTREAVDLVDFAHILPYKVRSNRSRSRSRSDVSYPNSLYGEFLKLVVYLANLG